MCFQNGTDLVRTNIDCGCILLGTTMAEDSVEMTWVIDCCWLLTAVGYRLLLVTESQPTEFRFSYTVTGHVSPTVLSGDLTANNTPQYNLE